MARDKAFGVLAAMAVGAAAVPLMGQGPQQAQLMVIHPTPAPGAPPQPTEGNTIVEVWDNAGCSGREGWRAQLNLGRPGDWQRKSFAADRELWVIASTAVRSRSGQYGACIDRFSFRPEAGKTYRVSISEGASTAANLPAELKFIADQLAVGAGRRCFAMIVDQDTGLVVPSYQHLQPNAVCSNSIMPSGATRIR